MTDTTWEPGKWERIPDADVIRSENDRITWEPVTDGWGVGFRIKDNQTGHVRYTYLYPSTDDGMTGGIRATTFVYEGPDGDAGSGDGPFSYIDSFPAESMTEEG